MVSVGTYHLGKKQLLNHLNGKECNEMKSKELLLNILVFDTFKYEV